MDIIQLGSVVTIYDFELEQKDTYKIVSSKDIGASDLDTISIDTPLAKALVGKFAGIQEVNSPNGKYKVEILKVDNTYVKIEVESKNVVALRKIIKKVSNEQKMEKEKREKAKQLAGYYKTHQPHQEPWFQMIRYYND